MYMLEPEGNKTEAIIEGVEAGRLFLDKAGTAVLHPLYLESELEGKGPKQGATAAIIPTYRRCPSEVPEKNPLFWCVRSLIKQRHAGIGEILIVDDGSDDYTEETVAAIKRMQNGVQINYTRGPNVGLAQNRNRGVERCKASAENVFFLDDDSVLPPLTIVAAEYLLDRIAKKDGKTAALSTPVYSRSTVPLHLAPLDKLRPVVYRRNDGGLELNLVENKFPLDYLGGGLAAHAMDPGGRLLKPAAIQMMSGLFLAKKEAYLKAGQFPAHLTWGNNASEEQEFSARLLGAGYKVALMADPSLAAVHFKFGARVAAGETIIGPHSADLREMLAVCANGVPKENTGCRVNPQEETRSRILAHFVMLAQRDAAVAAQVAHSYRSDMHGGRFICQFQGAIKGTPEELDEMWKSALEEGVALVNALTPNRTPLQLDDILQAA